MPGSGAGQRMDSTEADHLRSGRAVGRRGVVPDPREHLVPVVAADREVLEIGGSRRAGLVPDPRQRQRERRLRGFRWIERSDARAAVVAVDLDDDRGGRETAHALRPPAAVGRLGGSCRTGDVRDQQADRVEHAIAVDSLCVPGRRVLHRQPDLGDIPIFQAPVGGATRGGSLAIGVPVPCPAIESPAHATPPTNTATAVTSAVHRAVRRTRPRVRTRSSSRSYGGSSDPASVPSASPICRSRTSSGVLISSSPPARGAPRAGAPGRGGGARGRSARASRATAPPPPCRTPPSRAARPPGAGEPTASRARGRSPAVDRAFDVVDWRRRTCSGGRIGAPPPAPSRAQPHRRRVHEPSCVVVVVDRAPLRPQPGECLRGDVLGLGPVEQHQPARPDHPRQVLAVEPFEPRSISHLPPPCTKPVPPGSFTRGAPVVAGARPRRTVRRVPTRGFRRHDRDA